MKKSDGQLTGSRYAWGAEGSIAGLTTIMPEAERLSVQEFKKFKS